MRWICAEWPAKIVSELIVFWSKIDEGIPAKWHKLIASLLIPQLMGGKPCVRGQRVTVAMILGLLSAGRSRLEILEAYPYLEATDIDQCLAYAAWRMEEREVPLATA